MYKIIKNTLKKLDGERGFQILTVLALLAMVNLFAEPVIKLFIG